MVYPHAPFVQLLYVVGIVLAWRAGMSSSWSQSALGWRGPLASSLPGWRCRSWWCRSGTSSRSGGPSHFQGCVGMTTWSDPSLCRCWALPTFRIRPPGPASPGSGLLRPAGRRCRLITSCPPGRDRRGDAASVLGRGSGPRRPARSPGVRHGDLRLQRPSVHHLRRGLSGMEGAIWFQTFAPAAVLAVLLLSADRILAVTVRSPTMGGSRRRPPRGAGVGGDHPRD